MIKDVAPNYINFSLYVPLLHITISILYTSGIQSGVRVPPGVREDFLEGT
jgi:hypothetical protein